MSQRTEKYARNMERRTVMVEQRMDSMDHRMNRAAVEALEYKAHCVGDSDAPGLFYEPAAEG